MTPAMEPKGELTENYRIWDLSVNHSDVSGCASNVRYRKLHSDGIIRPERLREAPWREGTKIIV